MAFLLRNISYSADGRQIVRTSRVRDDLLKIGRDPDSDIRLNDLAVALHHATLEQISPTQIGVSAEMGMTIEIDGKAISFGQIDVATGGTIKIGPFRLYLLAAEPGSEDVAIDIERGDTDEAEEKFDTRRFALATVLPGKRPTAWALVLLVLALFLAWPIWSFYSQRNAGPQTAQGGFHADQMWTSGALSQGHASLEQNCEACHVRPFESVRDTACQACHTTVHDHADARRMERARADLGTFRRIQMRIGEAFGLDAGRCVDCHTEHEGPQQMVATPQQFCADCHTDIRGRLPDTRLASASDFERAHPEFQPSVLISWNGEQPVMQRVALNANPREDSGLKFPHALHLDPRGGAAQMGRRLSSVYGFGQQMECADCHVATPDGVRFQPSTMENNCVMCHSLAVERIEGTVRTLRHGSPEQVVADLRGFYRAGGPQRPAELAAAGRQRPGDVAQIRAAVQFAQARAGIGSRSDRAIRAVFSQGGACFDCHEVSSGAGPANYVIRPVAFPSRYMEHGWFDHRAHQIVQRPGQPRVSGSQACATCHAAPRSTDATDLLLPNVASCRDCHGGEQTRRPVPSTCAMCHDYHMDEGTPSLLLRRQVRGQRWETTVVTPTRSQPQSQAAPRSR
jgi:predicted CXXCH cytochrome family protein